MRRAPILCPALLLVGCAATQPTVSPDRVDELRARAKACRNLLPPDYTYEVDRFGVVRVSGLTPGPRLTNTDAFNDCVFGAGQWKDPTAAPAPAVRP